MKRHLFKLVLFLILGAIVNIAVAWGCAVWSVGGELYTNYFDDALPQPRLSSDDEAWMRSRGHDYLPNQSLTLHGKMNAFGFSYVEYYAIPITGLETSTLDEAYDYLDWNRPMVERTDCGWPCLSLGAEVWINPGVYAQWEAEEPIYIWDLYEYVGCIEVFVEADYRGKRQKVARPLPLRPIWFGFAINTIFYAGILWLLWSSPFTARRFIRHKRGLCIKCGYDLRGKFDSGCSECGWGWEEVKA